MKTPPLLTGAALVFWGWHTTHLGFAVPMAILLEGARLINWRFEIEDRDFNRVADFTSVFFLVLVVYQFSNRSMHGIYTILQLMPIVLFLLLTSQLYSQRGVLRMSTLFVSLRSKNQEPRRSDDGNLDLSYPYFLACVVSASVVEVRSLSFFLGASVLVGWALWPLRPKRYPAALWLALLLAGCVLGFGGQMGLRTLQYTMERFVMSMLGDVMWASRDPNRAITAIGTIGRLKMSDGIRVRIRTEGPMRLPMLLREASYDEFSFGTWRARHAEFASIDALASGTLWPMTDTEPTHTATISVKRKAELSVVPVPHGIAHIADDDILEVQRNDYGTVMLEIPPGHIDYQIAFDPASTSALPPTEQDLRVPGSYADDFEELAERLGLASMGPAQQVSAVEAYFTDNFTYSLVQRRRWPGRMPLTNFLNETRSGHCEYFATATVLLLRVVGIPARYTVGFSIQEYSQLERAYIARSRHSHSWAEVYVDGRWRVVDTTPGVWGDLEDEHASSWQSLLDLWSWLMYHLDRVRTGESGLEDYYVWLLIPLLALLVWRLTERTRVRRGTAELHGIPGRRQGSGLDSEFLALIKQLEAQGYALQQGEPIGAWLHRLARNPHSNAIVAPLRRLLTLHYRYRFDPHGLNPEQRRP